MVTEGVFTPAHVLAEAIRRREVSSVEVVEAYLAQIARHNPDLDAVVTLDEEGARVKAREADAALVRGEQWGPLHGVPITLEDLHPTSGMRSTWGGLPRLADHVPAEDGTVGARLKEAGAVSCSARPTGPKSGQTPYSPGPTTPGIRDAPPAGRAPVPAQLSLRGSRPWTSAGTRWVPSRTQPTIAVSTGFGRPNTEFPSPVCSSSTGPQVSRDDGRRTYGAERGGPAPRAAHYLRARRSRHPRATRPVARSRAVQDG